MKQKVALVLGSGGSPGLAQFGVIKELEKQVNLI
jgi:predicted acylesterase/phospholipase RssA